MALNGFGQLVSMTTVLPARLVAGRTFSDSNTAWSLNFMLIKPGPATLTSLNSWRPRSSSAIDSAISRGFLPSGFASCSATFVAKSPNFGSGRVNCTDTSWSKSCFTTWEIICSIPSSIQQRPAIIYLKQNSLRRVIKLAHFQTQPCHWAWARPLDVL